MLQMGIWRTWISSFGACVVIFLHRFSMRVVSSFFLILCNIIVIDKQDLCYYHANVMQLMYYFIAFLLFKYQQDTKRIVIAIIILFDLCNLLTILHVMWRRILASY